MKPMWTRLAMVLAVGLGTAAAQAAFTTHTLVLQDGVVPTIDGVPVGVTPYTDTLDTYTDQDNPAVNYGSADTLHTMRHNNAPNSQSNRGYLEFNNFQTWLPANAKIITGSIALTGAGDGLYNGASRVSYLTGSWSETTTTWSNQPAGEQQLGTCTYTAWVPWPAAAVKTLDISGVVQGWQQGTITNNGLLFRSPEDNTTYGERNFYASENTTAGNRPRMTITYAVNNENFAPPTGYEPHSPLRQVELLSGSSIIQDTYVNGAAPATTYSASTTVDLKTRNGDSVKRALIALNTNSGLLAGFAKSTNPIAFQDKRLISARLQLSGVGTRFQTGPSLWTCNQAWDPATATFSTRDGTNAWSQVWATNANQNIGSLVGSITADGPLNAGSGGYDITSILQGWIDGTQPNYGFVLGYTGADYTDIFALSEYSVAALRPTLVLEYWSVPEPGVAALLGLAGAGLLRRRARR